MRSLFSVLLIVTVLALDKGLATGQHPPKVPRIGVLSSGTASTPRRQRDREAFEQELQKLGYVEEKTIVIKYHYGSRRILSELAADLVRLKVSVIVTSAPSIRKSRTSGLSPVSSDSI